jgi:hypothetical protein
MNRSANASSHLGGALDAPTIAVHTITTATKAASTTHGEIGSGRKRGNTPTASPVAAITANRMDVGHP